MAPIFEWWHGDNSTAILADDARLLALIDFDMGWWNVGLIQQLFSDHQAQDILSIPLGDFAQKDYITWMQTSVGEFIVKTTYRVTLDLKNGDA